MITDPEILKAFKDKLVMVVDDEKFSRSILVRLLMPLETVEATSGSDGIYKFLSDPQIAMILSDFNMPGMDGLKMLKTIRTGFQGARHDVPVLMLTGSSDASLVSTAMKLDVDGFLVKPVSQAMLEARIKRMIGAARDIKPKKSYEAIDVDAVSERLLKTLSNDVEASKSAPSILSAQASKNAVRVALDALQPNAILMEDIKTPTGDVLIPSGQVLSERLIRRLGDLAPLGFMPTEILVSQ